MTIFYEVSGPEVPWGDYGNVLFHGLVEEDPDGPELPLWLKRVGPFIPKLAISYGHIIVTDELRRQFESMNFNGLTFRTVVKKQIVVLDWQSWDQNATDPEKFPSGGEPENYVTKRKHNPKMAEQLPLVYSVDVARVRSPLLKATFASERIEPSIDVFRFGWSFYVTRNLRDWLLATVPDCVSFSRGERLLG